MFRHRLLALAAAAAAFAAASACSENLEEGHACPALCPNQNIPVHDTTFDGLLVLSVDTTVTGYPPLGTEPALLVASEGDTVDVRGIVRFDSIPVLFHPTGDTLRPATRAIRPYIRLRIDSTSFRSGRGGALTIQAYDVDTVGNDTTRAVLASLFRSDRLLGQALFDSLTDSIRIPLDSGKIGAHIRGDRKVRIGFRFTTTGRIDVLNVSSGVGPAFSYFPDTDTTHVPALVTLPRSTTPVDDTLLMDQLLNFPLTVIASSPPIAQRLDVGGMPARRIYLRFALPSAIVDSATVIRATLTLKAAGFGAFLPRDSLTIFPQGIISTSLITDPTRAALFVASSALIGIDTVRIAPSTPDSVNIEFVNAVRRWSGHKSDSVSRAIVLRIAEEGADPLVASFFAAATSVPAAQRPHIHLSYVKRVGFGLP